MPGELYAALAMPFDVHFKDPRGLEYVTGNQVVGRLNEVLGVGGWSFEIKEHGYDSESDEMWVVGHLEADIDGTRVVREQCGSQKHNRRRDPNGGRGAILDYGFDAKGAATDAMKKCATLIGVGLYMSEKDGGIPQEPEAPQAARSGGAGSGRNTTPARQAASPPSEPQPYVPTRERDVSDPFKCVECGKNIVAQTGDLITASQADLIRDRFGALVCKEHRKAAAA